MSDTKMKPQSGKFLGVARGRRNLTLIVTLIPILLSLLFYIEYSRLAWFYQDDFLLLAAYSKRLAIEEVASFANFGRFISRNLYWYLGWRAFGQNAQAYFLLNLLIISWTSGFLYKIFSSRQDRRSGLVAALAYFCSLPVMAAYLWLANSQHLLGHLFVMLFVWYYLRSRFEAPNRRSLTSIALLSIILILGVLSNVFVGLTLSLPIAFAILDPRVRRNLSHWVWVASATLGYLIFVYSLLPEAPPAYVISYSLSTVQHNLNYYFLHMGIAILWMWLSLCGAAVALRAGSVFGFWLFVASLLFLSPFISLKYQHSYAYGTLTYVFFILGCWWLLWEFLNDRNKPFLIQIAGAVLTCGLFAVSFINPIHHALAYPKGAVQRNQVNALGNFNRAYPNIMHHCFTAEFPVGGNPRPVRILDTPRDWWGVGFGKAFSMFVEPNNIYELLGAKEENADARRSVVGPDRRKDCDVIHRFTAGTLHVDKPIR